MVEIDPISQLTDANLSLALVGGLSLDDSLFIDFILAIARMPEWNEI